MCLIEYNKAKRENVPLERNRACLVYKTRRAQLREIERNSKEKWLENGQQILLVRRSHDST